MQYITIPATITQEKVIPVFTFDELPADVQDTIIERASNRDDYEWFGEMIRDDIDLDVSQYWIPEHIEPCGVSVEISRHTHGGIIPEYAVEWSDRYGWDVGFSASVDLEAFIPAMKLGKRFALLLSAAKRGEISSASVGTPDIERKSPTASVELDVPSDVPYSCASRDSGGFCTAWLADDPRWRKLEAQAEEMQEIILEWYRDVTSRMESAFQQQADYYGSEEYYRDQMQYGEQTYTIDGSPYP